MKKFTYFLNVFALGFLLVSTEACKSKKEDDPTPNKPTASEVVSFTINGDGYSNQKFVIDTKNADNEGVGVFSASDNKTAIVAGGTLSSTKDVGFIMGIEGKKTGEIAIDEEGNGILITITDNGTDKMYSSVEGEGTIKVTKYENVGGNIEGTFSGKFINVATSENITISGGHFNVKRFADQQ